MTTEDVERMLPIVADSWTQLRRCDVYRLLSQFGAECRDAGTIVLTFRPDLKKHVNDACEDIESFA